MKTINLEDIQVLTVKEVCEKFKLSKSTIYKMVSNKEIPVKHIGSTVRFEKHALEKWWAAKAG